MPETIVFRITWLGMLLGLLVSGAVYSKGFEFSFLESTFLPEVLNAAPALIKQTHQQNGHEDPSAELALARYHPEELRQCIGKRLQTLGRKDKKRIKASLKELQKNGINKIRQLTQLEDLKGFADYQGKLKEEAPQAHRLKLVQAFDGLNHLSQWQTALYMAVYQEGLDSQRLSGPAPDAVTILEDFKRHNQARLLFVFRNTPSADIITLLDTLAKNRSREALKQLDQIYARCLENRSQIELRLSGEKA